MTDENLDKLMRKVLIDALRMEWSDALNESPTMSTTKEFQHQMKVMLRDPFACYPLRRQRQMCIRDRNGMKRTLSTATQEK